MEQIKQRDYRFDAFRGILIWCILVSHFTRVAGHYPSAFLGQVIYTTFMIFGMEGFVFLSGYFSKKPERARQTAFHTLLWPYILCIPFFFMIRNLIMGNAHLDLTIPPFALWYLFVLFIYRFFLKNYIKIPHIFEISLIVFLTAGLVPFFNDKFALGRMLSYFPFFLMGYYCTEEHMEKIRSLKKWHCGILAVILVGLSVVIVKFATQYPTAFILLKSPHNELGLTWYWDIIGRLGIFIIATGWIILLLNIVPNRNNYLVYIGKNTMPVYILHIIVRYLVKKHGITFGILPDNRILYYVLIFVIASLCVVVFSSPPIVRLYDLIIEGLYKVFMLILRAIGFALGLIHIPLAKIADGGMNAMYRIGGKAKDDAIAANEAEALTGEPSEEEPALSDEEKAEKAAAEDRAYDPAMWFKEKEAESDEPSEPEENDSYEDESSEDEPADADAHTADEPAEKENEPASESLGDDSDEDTYEEPFKGEPDMTEQEKANALEAENEAAAAEEAEEAKADEPAEESAADLIDDEGIDKDEVYVAEKSEDDSEEDEDASEDDTEEDEEAEDAEPEMTEEEKAAALEAEKEAFLASLFGKESIPKYEPKESDLAEAEAETAEEAKADEPAEQPAEDDDEAENMDEDASENDDADDAEEYDDDYEEEVYEEEGAKGFKDKFLSKFKSDKAASLKSLFKKEKAEPETDFALLEEPAPKAEPEEKVIEFAVYGMTQEEVEAIMNIKREEEAPAPAEEDAPEEAETAEE